MLAPWWCRIKELAEARFTEGTYNIREMCVCFVVSLKEGSLLLGEEGGRSWESQDNAQTDNKE